MLVNDRTVLTAQHVAEGTDHRVECAAGFRGVASVLRSGSPAADLALLTLAEPVNGLDSLAVARIDRNSVGVLTACAVGFPRWRRDSRHRRTAQVDGTIPTAEGLAYTAPSGETEGLLTLVGNRAPGAPPITTGPLLDTELGTGLRTDSPSPWGGMSGAGVVCGESVIGVVRSHNVAVGLNALTVTPLTALDLLPPEVRKRFWELLGVVDAAKLPVLAAAGTAVSAVNTLPRSVPDFTGRDAALQELLDATSGDGFAATSVITIHAIDGMGGVGKTELALHAAHRLTTHYTGAQLFIDLQGFSLDRSPVPPTSALESLLIAAGIAVEQVPATLEQRATLWRATLARRRALLILDNAVSVEQITPLLPGNSECAVLITSRRRLIDLEGTKLVTLDTLDEPSAVELLNRIVAGATPVDGEQMHEVVRLCGCLPLAIRVAGARLRRRPQLGLSGLITELSGAHGRLGALRSSERDVRAAFDVSYEALEPDARRLFRRLGVHPGQDATVADVAELAELSQDIAERLLEDLLGDNLVQELRSGRFSLHELLRDYARDRARQDERPAEQAATLDRLFGRYAELVAAANQVLVLSSARATARPRAREAGCDPALAADAAALSPSEARQWLAAEHANIVGCAQLACERRSGHALRLTVAAGPLLLLGYADDAGALYKTALVTARTLGDCAAEAAALLGLGEVARSAGRVAAARDSFEGSRALCVELEDAGGQARALYGLGELERTAGRYGTALEYYEAAYAICCDAGDMQGQADALQDIGLVAQVLGDSEAAREHYRRSAALREETGNPRPHPPQTVPVLVQGFAYLGLAECAEDYAAAHERFERAAAICLEAGNRRGFANARYGLAEVARATGDWDRARGDYARTQAICEEIGNVRGQAGALLGLGKVEEAVGNDEAAVAHYQAACDLCQQIGYQPEQATALCGIGEVALRRGDPQRAVLVWDQARALFSGMRLDQQAREVNERIQKVRREHSGLTWDA